MNDLPPQPSTSTMEFICQNPDCIAHSRKIFRTSIEPTVLNGPETSVAIYSHEKGVTCNYCNTYYQVTIIGFNSQIVWKIIPVSRPSGLVLAPSGLVTQ